MLSTWWRNVIRKATVSGVNCSIILIFQKADAVLFYDASDDLTVCEIISDTPDECFCGLFDESQPSHDPADVITLNRIVQPLTVCVFTCIARRTEVVMCSSVI